CARGLGSLIPYFDYW
nr:immunoglobulin heavy chain junction region [Macaca mulatta]MOX92441.1 immunoglobulin heavy chain junction region [Macaca mulatta]MOX92652.1 immunoglobulin heavy chain junction region [Macaca mulatta]MOX94156.1 immunoglobulin heavy chain junction region [Macaca mulatta]